MDWFYDVFGFYEQGQASILQNVSLEGMFLHCHANNTTLQCGRLEIPRLAFLREQTEEILRVKKQKTTIREMVGNVQHFHMDPQNKNAVFQVASQCNLLEMVGPSVTPEEGITGYFYDRTQGPVCAMSCAAGTLQRNYLVEITDDQKNVQIGQSANLQVDTLKTLGRSWGNDQEELWEMRNGYALASLSGLQQISQKLQQATSQEYDAMMGDLHIGMQWDTEVTLDHTHPERLLVQQAYCSAMPVAYSRHSDRDWKEFGRFVLNGAYEATLLAGVWNSQRGEESGSNRVFLTLLGGGAFGNPTEWILDAMFRALMLVQDAGLDVVVVSYGYSNSRVQDLIARYQESIG